MKNRVAISFLAKAGEIFRRPSVRCTMERITAVVLVGLGICRQTRAHKKGARFPQGSTEIGDVKVYPTPGTVVIYCGLLASGSTFWRR